MPQTDAKQAISFFSTLVIDRLSQASALAKAAGACWAEGQSEPAMTIASEIEHPLYEATTALNAIRLIARASKV